MFTFDPTLDTLRFDAAAAFREPRVLAFLVADWGSKTADGKVALGGVFDKVIMLPDNPRTNFVIYLRTVQVYENPGVDLLMFDPNGVAALKINLQVDPDFKPAKDQPNYLQFLTFIGVEFKQPGIYWFDIRYKNDSIAQIPLLVERQV